MKKDKKKGREKDKGKGSEREREEGGEGGVSQGNSIKLSVAKTKISAKQTNKNWKTMYITGESIENNISSNGTQKDVKKMFNITNQMHTSQNYNLRAHYLDYISIIIKQSI